MPKRNCDLIQHNKQQQQQQQQRGYMREETSKKRKIRDLRSTRTRTCDNVTKENNANETCSPSVDSEPTLLWKLWGCGHTRHQMESSVGPSQSRADAMETMFPPEWSSQQNAP
jgi:L-asparaginase II